MKLKRTQIVILISVFLLTFIVAYSGIFKTNTKFSYIPVTGSNPLCKLDKGEKICTEKSSNPICCTKGENCFPCTYINGIDNSGWISKPKYEEVGTCCPQGYHVEYQVKLTCSIPRCVKNCNKGTKPCGAEDCCKSGQFCTDINGGKCVNNLTCDISQGFKPCPPLNTKPHKGMERGCCSPDENCQDIQIDLLVATEHLWICSKNQCSIKEEECRGLKVVNGGITLDLTSVLICCPINQCDNDIQTGKPYCNSNLN